MEGKQWESTPYGHTNEGPNPCDSPPFLVSLVSCLVGINFAKSLLFVGRRGRRGRKKRENVN